MSEIRNAAFYYINTDEMCDQSKKVAQRVDLRFVDEEDAIVEDFFYSFSYKICNEVRFGLSMDSYSYPERVHREGFCHHFVSYNILSGNRSTKACPNSYCPRPLYIYYIFNVTTTMQEGYFLSLSRGSFCLCQTYPSAS